MKRRLTTNETEVSPLTPIEMSEVKDCKKDVEFRPQPSTLRSQTMPPSLHSRKKPATIFPKSLMMKRKRNKSDQPWISQHISYKVCTTFIKNPKSPNECLCGGVISEHIPNVSVLDGGTWDKETCTRRQTGYHFGRIKFVEEDGTHQPDFVRIGDDFMKKEKWARKVTDLLEKRWKLDKPNLLISVTGGAQDFVCPAELKKRFQSGLVRAAKSTNAWIFTGGTNTGVMKLVGEAVRGTSFGSQIITIGIATWGIIKNREQLGLTKNPQRKSIFPYDTKECKMTSQKRGAFLDPNHTHFLLVDDGTQYQYGKEIEFRANLEQRLSERYAENGVTLPQICILVEGGPNSIKTVLEVINLGNPALVIAGSGRAADVIGEAHKLSVAEEAYVNGERTTIRTISDANQEKVRLIIREKFANTPDPKKDEMFQWTLDIIKQDKYLTVYLLNDSKEFDLALLAALIRGNKEGTSSLASMRLAITWNRPQLAHTLILPNSKFTESEQNELLHYAIVSDKPDFIKMILNQGVDMKYFLSEAMLASLYNSIDSTCISHKKLRHIANCAEGKFSVELCHVGHLMEKILEGTYRSQFTSEAYMGKCDTTKSSLFENPYDRMVVFAALTESQEMAKLFWERCKTPIATGLIAYKIFKYLANLQRNRLNRDEENEKTLLEWAQEFQDLSVGVMNQCFKDRNHEKELWLDVLTMPHKSWGNLNVVEIANTTEAENFIAQGAVQSWLSDIWLGHIHAAQSTIKIICAVFLPPLVPMIRYTKKAIGNELDDEEKNQEKSNDIQLTDLENVENGPNTDDETEIDGQLPRTVVKNDTRKLTFLEKYASFYTAPIVKFQIYICMYLAFLITFIVTLLVRQEDMWHKIPPYSGPEIFLFLYVLSTIPIEINQVKSSIPSSLRLKLWAYLSDFFNVLDVLAAVCFITAFGIKWGTNQTSVPVHGKFELFNYWHLLMILSFLFYCFRLLQMFRIQANMGPKIVMIGKMIIDLVFFIFLMLIFLLGYGVCAQALMRPNVNHTIKLKTVWDVIFRPYVHVFGELDLDGMYDELVEGHCDDADKSCDINTIRDNEIGEVHYYVLMGIMFLYLLFVNILLVNLLIAIFSKTYEDIQQESDTIWKVQKYQMILEYREILPVPQPFSIIFHIFFGIRYIFKSCFRACCMEPQINETDESRSYRVSMIEAETREEFMSKMEDTEKISTNKAFKDLKDQLSLMKALIETKSTTIAPPATQILEQFRPSSDSRLTKIKPLRVHMDARKSPYPNTTIERFPVPDDKVSWLSRYVDYKPVKYTAPEIDSHTSDSIDPPQPGPKMLFNKVEKTKVNNKVWTVDRTSHHGLYHVINNLPQNPKGRTGMIGRGLLQRWGPNHAADTIVTRWHRSSDGEVVKIEEKPVLEFVGILRKDSNEWAIPGGRVKPNERVFDAIKREFSEDALANLSATKTEQEKISEMLREHFNLGITVYKGYVDDPRNTDNAWIETIAVNYHDSFGTSFSKFPLKAHGTSLGVQWIPIDYNIDLYANHEWIIEKVCYHRDAYNPIKEPKRKENEVWLTSL